MIARSYIRKRENQRSIFPLIVEKRPHLPGELERRCPPFFPRKIDLIPPPSMIPKEQSKIETENTIIEKKKQSRYSACVKSWPRGWGLRFHCGNEA